STSGRPGSTPSTQSGTRIGSRGAGTRPRPRALELSGHVRERRREDRAPVTEALGTPVAGPIGMQVAEETPLRVGLDAEHVSCGIAEGRDIVRRPARAPGIPGVAPAVIDVPEDDLVVLDELPQDLLLPLPREENLPLCVRGDD